MEEKKNLTSFFSILIQGMLHGILKLIFYHVLFIRINFLAKEHFFFSRFLIFRPNFDYLHWLNVIYLGKDCFLMCGFPSAAAICICVQPSL